MGGENMARSTARLPSTKARQRRRTIVIDGPHPIDLHVGARIRLQRIMHGMTQSELAKLIGISFQSVQKYERGENRVSASRLHEFATALGVNEQFFFDGIGTAAAPGTEPPREASLSASEGREFRRQLEAVMAIEDKRMRGLIVQLLKLLSEASGTTPPSPEPAEVPPEP
jgi:transcriptional regulator with XRE-family HTH domain